MKVDTKHLSASPTRPFVGARPVSTRLCAVVIVAVVALGGCGSSSNKSGDASVSTAANETTVGSERAASSNSSGGVPDSESAVSSAPVPTSTPSSAMSTEGLPTGDGLIALVAVARQSVTDVPMLHNFAVGLGRQDGIPNSVIVSEAEKLQLRFASAGTTASKSGGEASEALATAFRSYADLAGQLGAAAEGSEPLPEGFAAALTRADSSWRAAVQAVAKADGSDLLATLPPLLMPDSPSSKTIPPPPK